jgi:hypothetical protein
MRFASEIFGLWRFELRRNFGQIILTTVFLGVLCALGDLGVLRV